MLVALSRNDAKRCGETCVAAGVRTLEETPPDGIPQLSHKHYAHISHIFHDRAMSAALHTTPLAFDFAEGVSLFHFFLGPQQFRHTSLGILSLAILRRSRFIHTFHLQALVSTALESLGVLSAGQLDLCNTNAAGAELC